MPASDEVLQSFLKCSDEQSADELLTKLLFEQAEPLIRGVLQHRLRGAASLQDHEDLTGEVILELLERLRGMRQPPDPREHGAIGSFGAYVRTVAHHACDGFFRRRFPQRHRLKNRLRYVLRADPRFALWTDSDGATVCGRAAWQGQSPCRSLPSRVQPPASLRLEAALEVVFADLGRPAELDDVTGLLAAAWGVRDALLPLEAISGQSVNPADPADRLDDRRRLERLWSEIVLLPRDQRTALLLHIRDDRGGPALALLPASGVASLSQIAEALDMPEGELAQLWNNLPLGDSEIGPRLRVNRQKVINLRSSARQRLARRTAPGRVEKTLE